MNETEAMRAFVQVADAGSFSAAAAALGLMQPTVSRRLAELEGRLGVALITRTTRSVALTAAGEAFLPQARAALAAVDAALSAAQRDQMGLGRLRVAAAISFARAVLTPALPALLREHPALDLDLHLADHHIDLVAEGVDVALRIGGPDSANLSGRRLRQVSRLLVASPDWVSQNGPLSRVADLATVTGLLFAAHGPGAHVVWPRQFDTDPPVAPQRLITATNGQPLLALAEAGHGVAVLPDWMVGEALAAGRLVQVLPEVVLPMLPLWVVWPSHRFTNPAVRVFVEWITASRAITGWGAL